MEDVAVASAIPNMRVLAPVIRLACRSHILCISRKVVVAHRQSKPIFTDKAVILLI